MCSAKNAFCSSAEANTRLQQAELDKSVSSKVSLFCTRCPVCVSMDRGELEWRLDSNTEELHTKGTVILEDSYLIWLTVSKLHNSFS